MDNMNHLLFDFLDKNADMYEGKDAINPELYDLYKVKRGLRDKNGNGVVAGLTTISTIEAFDISGDQKPQWSKSLSAPLQHHCHSCLSNHALPYINHTIPD